MSLSIGITSCHNCNPTQVIHTVPEPSCYPVPLNLPR
nr:MAG TPA: hypothetical protein [Caudoviricetes sp.]